MSLSPALLLVSRNQASRGQKPLVLCLKTKLQLRMEPLQSISFAKNDGGIYMCKAENILGRATDTVQLVVFSPLQFKVRPPQEITPLIGSTLHLPCVAASELRTTIS